MKTQSNPVIIAHRGYSARAPENTLAAFQMAVAADVSWIELDVRRTKDNVFVVLHDASLQRTSTGAGYLKNIEWKDVQRYDAGSWFGREFAAERIPTLKEVLAAVPENVSLNLELKPARLRKQGYTKFVIDLLELLHKSGRAGSVLISSFSSMLLRIVREADNDVRLGILTHGKVSTRPTLRELHALHADWFIHNIRTLRPSVVTAIRDAGYAVAAFTVNTPKQAVHALHCGVDYIITNEVEAIREIVTAAPKTAA